MATAILGVGNIGGAVARHLGVAGLVVDEVVAGRAVPAGLEKSAARSVPGGFRRGRGFGAAGRGADRARSAS